MKQTFRSQFSPGPPAEKLPPPPIMVFKTQKGMKSGCWWETDSRPIAMCASSGMGVGPRLTSEIKKNHRFDRNTDTYESITLSCQPNCFKIMANNGLSKLQQK